MTSQKIVHTAKDYEKHYEEFYKDEDYDIEWRLLGAKDKVQNIITLCSSLNPQNMLDIGGGDGIVGKILAEREFCKQMYFIELSTSAINLIKSQTIPYLVEAIKYQGVEIPYEDNKFDLAVCTHVIEHVENPRVLLNEMKRVAKYCFFEVPLEDNFNASPNFVWSDTGHINFYNPRTFKFLLQSCGFEVMDMKITLPSLQAHLYAGNKFENTIKYNIKKGLLGVNANLAASLFTYHFAVLCKC